MKLRAKFKTFYKTVLKKTYNSVLLDDSAVVDDMFGFLEEQKDSGSDAPAPSAFRDLPAPKNIQTTEVCVVVASAVLFMCLHSTYVVSSGDSLTR